MDGSPQKPDPSRDGMKDVPAPEDSNVSDTSSARRKSSESNQPKSTRGRDRRVEAADLGEVTRYDPKSDLRHPIRLSFAIVRDIWIGRELCWRLFNRNLRALYRQTLLGLFWAFLPPVAQTAVWVFLNSANIVKFETSVNYVAYVLTGMILWQAFLDSFLAPLAAVNSGRSLLTKINFPRESILVVAIGEVVLNLLIRSSLLILVFLFFDVSLTWTIIVAPIGLLFLVVFGTALGLLTVPIGVLYHDVPRFLTLATPFWMLLTPIIYPPPTSGIAETFVNLNPVTPILVCTRDLILLGQSDYIISAILVVAISMPLLLIGLIGYRTSMPILIERMG